MASRKSSILKPRKAREPLQDLNQLLPNNDDEETTTTEIQKRRVSFASTNKVKEFESAAECVTLKHTPVYDERFSISSDSCQSSVLSVSHVESSKMSIGCQSIVPDNVGLSEDDLEITETAGGKIINVSVKDGFGDCSMELTTPCIVGHFEQVEESGPLNLTTCVKNSCWSEFERVNQSRIDLNDCSMETTSVITNSVVAESFVSQYSEIQLPECNISIPAIPESRKSIFHPADGFLPPRKSLFEMSIMQPIIKENSIRENMSMDMSYLQMEEENPCEKSQIVDAEVEEMKTQSPVSLESTLMKSSRLNSSMPMLGQNPENKTYHNSSMQLTSRISNDTRYNNSSMQLLSQELKSKIVEESKVEKVIEKEVASLEGQENVESQIASQRDSTRINNSSMNLVSQEPEVAVECAPVVPDACQGTDKSEILDMSCNGIEHEVETNVADVTKNKTRYSNVTMQMASQESELTNVTENKTHYSTVNMQSVTGDLEEEADSTANITVNMENVSQQLGLVNSMADKTRYSTTNMQMASQNYEVAGPNQSLNQVYDESTSSERKCENGNGPTVENNHETSNETATQKNESAISSNDSNSPLTVGVNFSIFQKNKEMRVEFSGTIDSNRKHKSKSISNVHVNIFDNEKENKKKNVRELRFSMPANKVICHTSSEPLDSQSQVPSKDDTHMEQLNQDLKSVHLGRYHDTSVQLEPVFMTGFDILSSKKKGHKQQDEATQTPTRKKRRSSEMIDANELSGQLKRPSLTNTETGDGVSIPSDDLSHVIETVPKAESAEETKIVTQRRQSFIQEEKIFAVNSDSDITGESKNITTTHIAEQSIQEVKQGRRSFLFETSIVKSEALLSCSKGEKSVTQSNQTFDGPSSNAENDKLMSEKSVDFEIGINSREESKDEVSQPSSPIADSSLTNLSNNYHDPLSARHSTPFSQRSLVGLSMAEDELDDNPLNNPSIIVNVGDSSHYKSLELATDNSPSVEGCNSSNEQSKEELKNPIENMASDNILKENLVTDWLHSVKFTNKTFEKLNSNFANVQLMTSFENNKSHVVNEQQQQLDKEYVKSKEERSETIVSESELEEKLEKIPEQVAENLEEQENLKHLLENEDEVREQVLQTENVEKDNESLCFEKSLVEAVENVQDIFNKCPMNLDEEIANMSIDTEDGTDDVLQRKVDEETEQIVSVTDAVVPKGVEEDPLDAIESDENYGQDLRLVKEKKKEANISFLCPQDYEEMLKKLSTDLKEIREWSIKKISSDTWSFKLDSRLPQFFYLCIEFQPNTSICSAKLEFSATTDDKDFEVKKVAFKWLTRKCDNKLRNLCHSLSDVYYLMKLTSTEVLWAAKFVRDFIALQQCEDIKLEHRVACFEVASYKQCLLFTVHVNLANLHKITASDVKIEEKIGNVNTKQLFSIFSDAGHDFNFLSKFVKRMYRDFEA